MSDDMKPFDVLGPLPAEVAVLEASAGTGKTYTIAALAARFVADGLPLENLLVVTFTRMATGELRERVRDRLVGTERALAAIAAGTSVVDPVAQLMATGSTEEVALRRARLSQAVAEFDAATITTTHGFCLEVLGSLGFAGDIERGCAFVEDVADLVDEIVDDLYIRRFWNSTPAFSRSEAAAIVAAAIANPAAHLEPTAAPPDTVAAMRLRLAVAARAELERRKRRMSIMTFDDLLTRLDDTLTGRGGDEVAARLRSRYRVVLVDEFQDTDPVQWSIMRRAFGEAGSTLVLIGDPKQAIYAFRGADVYAYLDAAESAGTSETLDVNWRSDQGLITAYDALFAGAQLGHEGIVYRQVTATPGNQTPRLSGAPHPAPLRLRVVDRNAPAVGITRGGYASTARAREHIAADLAADVVALLSSHAKIETRADDGAVRGRRRVQPGDIAVLVRTHKNAAMVRDALYALSVPAVINGAGSVFGSLPARDWLRLLEALERPTSSQRARSAAMTPFIGWSAEQVAAADDDAWAAVHGRLHHWAEVLRVKGVASLTETITLGEQLAERVLAVENGERRLTDLRHVGQLLHAAATSDHLGTAALTAWLRRRIAMAGEETDEERSRRLESDAAAVQVLTIHRSKGLEFPIVYYPYLWEPTWIPEELAPVFFHDPQENGRRTLDVGLDGPDFAGNKLQHKRELRGEDLRLAYVALTRAQHQAVVWWAGSWSSRDSPLGRLLFDLQPDGSVPETGAVVPSDAEAIERLEELRDTASGQIAVEQALPGPPTSWSGEPKAEVALSASTFDRRMDWGWRRTSYSDITAAGYEAHVHSEPEADLVVDEPPAPDAPDDTRARDDFGLRETPSLLSDMPAGVKIGSLAHEVLEATDFAAESLVDEVGLRLDEGRRRRPVDVGDEDAAVAGMCAAIETPMGPLVGDLRLRDLVRADRIDEMIFELPLVGGDAPTGKLSPGSVGQALRKHLSAGDPLLGYADRLDDPALRSGLRGYLTGSIDLVFRSDDGTGRHRYGIVDYKTNRLGAYGESLTAWDHRPEALTAEMYRAHYALQGLLYTVALHRYLRWRVADYQAERDIAGVFYLFLRGMTGSETPRVDGVPCGVFAWRPPGALVESLSDLLDQGELA